MLPYLLKTIELETNQPLKNLSPLKVQTILFFAQLDYFSTTGDKLFDEQIRCYYDGVKIDGFEDLEVAEEGIDEALIRRIISNLCEQFIPLDDSGLLDVLYHSSAFLRANVAPGNRLTNLILHDYYDIGQHFSFLQQDLPRKMVDRVVIHEELIDELEEDVFQFN